MTRFFFSEPIESQGQLAVLAEAGVRLTLELGARIAGPLQQGDDVHAALASATEILGGLLSNEMVDYALANAGDAPVDARANKLAFQLLTTVPSSPVAQLLAAVTTRAFRRAGAAFGPLLDADDLLSMLRWRLWTIPADHFAPSRILKHPGLAAYLSVIARRMVIDQCRAMDNRGRVDIDLASIEASADPRATLDAVLDDLDLLQRLAHELPEWEATIVEVLTGQVERDSALREINRKREVAGLAPWSADSMRTAVHRVRKRLRGLLIKTPPRLAHEHPLPSNDDGPQVHDWHRFWCTRDGMYSLDDNGFLVDPETEFGRHVHPIVALERLENTSCLALLGEPGIGKSTVIRQEQQRLTSENREVVLVDLSRTSGGDALHRSLARASASLTSPVFVFFDALDEGLSRNPSLTSELISVIETLDVSRVRLRIACRTLEWPAELEAWLRQRYEPEAFRVQELLPLRRIDVVSAANDHGTDGADFVREVRERDVTALAIRPISLRFLLAMFATDGALPHSKARLFDEGTLILCSEEAALQRGRNRRNPDVFRRRAIAGRLAAASTFANRHAIARSELQDDAALPANIAVGVDRLPDATYSIDMRAVEDVLSGTALFTARTSTTFGWNHQSYREFLAAWCLAQHKVGVEAVERLYFPNGVVHVPGPLREVAAWHATFVPALFDQLVERDPEVLLHSDGAAVSTESRAQLVRALLDRMARYEALDSRYYRRDYQKLAHPQLGDQLRHYIKDRSANIIVRRAAMDIAWSCAVRDVMDELTAVLVNREDDQQAREVAARALAELGGDQVRDLFTALLVAGFAPDPDDSIRGSVLSFLWPDHIDAPTLFRHLALPQRDDLLGAYQRFLADLPDSLKPDQLGLALEWAEAIGGRAEFHLQHAQHDIIERALRFVDREDVRAVLVRIIRASLHSHLGTWYADGPAHNRTGRTLPTSDRRLLARDLIVGTADDERIGNELVFFDPPLIGPDDIEWIAGLARSGDERIQRAAGRCVAAIYFGHGYPADAVAADAVVSIESSAFREPLGPLFAPVELGSEVARDLATRWDQVHRPLPEEPDNEPPEPSLWLVASPLLARIEAGDLIGWIEFVRWADGLPKPIADSTEWSALASADRERIILAALRYLQGFQAPDIAWLDKSNEFPYSAVAARSALQLIAATRPALLDALAEPVWRQWCPVLVAVPFPDLTDAQRTELIRRCVAFDELSTTIVRIARRDNRPDGHVSVFSELPRPVPESLHSSLLLLAPELRDDAFEDVLEMLLPVGNQGAGDLARVAIRDASPARAARAARALLPYDAAQWPLVLARMQRECDFIDAFAPLVAYREDMAADPFGTLDAQRAAELYLILLRQYPHADDHRGPRGVLTLPDYLERLRRRVIGMLSNAGTVDAIRALEWLRDQEPNRETLRYILVEARQKLADTAWRPLSLEQVKSTLLVDADVATNSSAGRGNSIPPVSFATPQRQDVGRDELLALLSGVHVLIETATSTETAAVLAAMQPLPGRAALVVGSGSIATYTIGLLGNYAVAHFQSDMGNEGPNAAHLATNDAIVESRPKLVLFVGIAFGLQPAKQRLGDVLVAQHITSYEMVKLRPDSVEERGETLRADATLIERIHAHGRTWQLPRPDGTPVAFHVGQMLSGAKLVNNVDFRDALVRRFPTALGGEMEGTGAYAAAFRHRVPALLVKAICDWADGMKDDHAQSFAAKTATDLVRYVLGKPDVLASLGIAVATVALAQASRFKEPSSMNLFINNGQVGAFGPNASAQGNTFQQRQQDDRHQLGLIRTEAKRIEQHADQLNRGLNYNWWQQCLPDKFRPADLEDAIRQARATLSSDAVLVSNLDTLRATANAADAEADRILDGRVHDLGRLRELVLRVLNSAPQVVSGVDRILVSFDAQPPR